MSAMRLLNCSECDIDSLAEIEGVEGLHVARDKHHVVGRLVEYH